MHKQLAILSAALLIGAPAIGLVNAHKVNHNANGVNQARAPGSVTVDLDTPGDGQIVGVLFGVAFCHNVGGATGNLPAGCNAPNAGGTFFNTQSHNNDGVSTAKSLNVTVEATARSDLQGQGALVVSVGNDRDDDGSVTNITTDAGDQDECHDATHGLEDGGTADQGSCSGKRAPGYDDQSKDAIGFVGSPGDSVTVNNADLVHDTQVNATPPGGSHHAYDNFVVFLGVEQDPLSQGRVGTFQGTFDVKAWSQEDPGTPDTAPPFQNSVFDD